MKAEISSPPSQESARPETDSVHILIHGLLSILIFILSSGHTSQVISFPTETFYVFHKFRPSFIFWFNQQNVVT
jgi:hypothetical protein